jgi:hypothetical protein
MEIASSFKPPLFPLGRTVATPGALKAVIKAGVPAVELLRRHQRGDWGDVCVEDAKLNNQAVEAGERLLSSYDLGGSVTVWIITEADRSVSTMLLPHEY